MGHFPLFSNFIAGQRSDNYVALIVVIFSLFLVFPSHCTFLPIKFSSMGSVFRTLVFLQHTILFYQLYYVKTFHVHRSLFIFIPFLLFMDFLFFFFSHFISLTSTIIYYLHIFLLRGNFLSIRRSIVPASGKAPPLTTPRFKM
jgi:hypothetical protein